MILARLLRGRFLALWHTLVPRPGRRSPRRATAARTAAVVGFVLGGLTFGVVRELITLLLGDGGGMGDAVAALATIVNLTLVGLLVFDLHEGLSALLIDSDLDLLRRAPMPPAALLGLKLVDALPRTSLLLAVLVAPSVVAFHTAFPLPAWGWALLPLQLLALWATPLGFGLAASLKLLRHVPARHAREALGLVSTLTLFTLWLANSFLLPRIGTTAGSLTEVRSTLAHLAALAAPTPGAWMGRALAAAARGDVAATLLATAVIVCVAAGALALATWVAARDLERVQTRILSGGSRRRDPGRAPRRLAVSEHPRGIVGAMLARDARLIARHWTILGDLLTTAVLWTLLPVVVSPLFETSREALARAMLLALTVAMGNELAARALPLERGAIVWARLAPLPAARWLAGRLAGAGILAAVLLAIATAGTVRTLELGPAEVLRLLAVVIPALALALSTGLWAGAAFGDPTWTNPRAMLTPAGRVIATLLLVAQGLGWLVLTGETPHVPGVPPTATLQAVAAGVGLLVAVAAFADAARRLGRSEMAGA